MKKEKKIPRSEEMRDFLAGMAEKAKMAAQELALMPASAKNICLEKMADGLENSTNEILEANRKDIEHGRENGLSSAMLDRLTLDQKRIKAMADGLRQVAALDDPVGRTLSSCARPNGLLIEKVSVPIGVICIIYESRPNVTADSAGLCLKAGNSVILRGGSESIHSNLAIAHCLNISGISAGLPEGSIQLVPFTDREAVSALLKMHGQIDLVIPRGGEGLIRTVVEQSTIPVIKHYKGVCHTYVDSKCDMDMALKIVENAKCQRPGVCNAMETLLIHKDIANDFVPKVAALLESKGVELRGCCEFRKIWPKAIPASEEDWFEEYLDMILSVRVVPDITAAIKHINYYGSKHSDSIVTSDNANSAKFLKEVDSATVYVNASTRFTDGGEFGMGAEIGISTDKLHARGPMGLQELTIYKYLIYGNGQCRG